MKIRNGFISNTSSSSFIIVIDKKLMNECPHCHRHDKNILDLILGKTDKWSDTKLRGRGKDGTIAALKNWSCIEDQEFKLLKKKIEDADERGMDVGFIDISNHDESLNDEFRSQEKSGTLKILLDNN